MGRHSRVTGRHRAPSTAGRTAARIAISAGVATAPFMITNTAAASPPGVADTIANCESSNRNVDRQAIDGKSTASGYYMFVNGTWAAFGGRQFAPRAVHATKAEQTIVFERAYAANGLVDWEASRACWQPKLKDTARPARHAVAETPRRDHSYTVRRGDTLTKIAGAHHTTWKRIYAANRDAIADPDRIYIGQRLHV